jgi:tetratricopeptide (TPR) repeat protein
MRLWLTLAVAGLWTSVAYGAPPVGSDKVVIAAAPEWVRPAPVPALNKQAEGAAFQMLVQDQQVSFQAGSKTVYSRTVLTVQSPQGLAAGAVNFAWNPDFDTPIVHVLRIRRGEQLIDVLASQTFTVVRRESNLENAMLDGVLTATLQPEGLQVGDTVEFAVSIRSAAPLLGGHLEQIGGAWNGVPIGRASFRATWPKAMNLRLRQTEGLPTIKVVDGKEGKQAEIALDALQPITLPNGAPPRYRMLRMIELSDLADWSDLAARMTPLYVTASALPDKGPLRDEADRIRAAQTDPAARMQAALTLVQDRVRYVFLGMNGGNYVPADAVTTWSRRFGDCKGKTALLLALLHALDIEAVPVLVSSNIGDGIDRHLPMLGMFDHIIVRARIGGQTYWLDGTRTGDRLERLRVPAFGFGLPVEAKGATLVRIMPPPLDQPTSLTEIAIDASRGVSLAGPVKASATFRADEALGLKLALANLAADQRDQALRAFWREQLDGAEIERVADSYDAGTGELKMTLVGTIKLDWDNGWYEFDAGQIGYKADFHRDPGPNQDAPFQVGFPVYSRRVQKVTLPPAYRGRTNLKPSKLEQTIAATEYHRSVSIDGDVITVEGSLRTLAPEFAAAQAADAQTALRKLNDDRIFLRRLDVRSEAETAALLDAKSGDVPSRLQRGYILMEQGRFDEAIAGYSAILSADARNELALANRGLGYAWLSKTVEARKDLDAAELLNPRNAVVFRARGILNEQEGKFDEAIKAYTIALDIDPTNGWALLRRATVYRRLQRDDAALADAATAIRLNPAAPEPYLMRANILRNRGDMAGSLAEAKALITAQPDSSYAQVAAARIFSAGKAETEAKAAFDRALAIKPEAFIYLNRGYMRPESDLQGRRADFESALKLDPTSDEALIALASVLRKSGESATAIARISDRLKNKPGDQQLLLARGIAYASEGRNDLADKDFAATRTKADTAISLNELCWAKAVAGVALATALAECDASLAMAPELPAAIDSRAFVLLRLGRLDEALAAYDRALALTPTLSASLYGRAIVHARKGDKARSEADAAAARKTYPDVDADFASYGMTL